MAAIATAATRPRQFFCTTYAGSYSLLCFSVMYSDMPNLLLPEPHAPITLAGVSINFPTGSSPATSLGHPNHTKCICPAASNSLVIGNTHLHLLGYFFPNISCGSFKLYTSATGAEGLASSPGLPRPLTQNKREEGLV